MLSSIFFAKSNEPVETKSDIISTLKEECLVSAHKLDDVITNSNYESLAQAKKVYKKKMIEIINKLKVIPDISYRVFDEIFDTVIKSKVLDEREHPWWDTFFRKTYTQSKFELLGLIRQIGLELIFEKLKEKRKLLHSQLSTPEKDRLYEEIIEDIKSAETHKIFNLTLSNFYNYTPQSYFDLENFKEDVENNEFHSKLTPIRIRKQIEADEKRHLEGRSFESWNGF